MEKYLVLLSLIFLTGCAEIIRSVAVNGGVQVVGEQYLITQKKPITKCNVVNVVKGNNICRVTRVYVKKI